MVLTGPIVMKFGGTSVADADAIARVVGIVKARPREFRAAAGRHRLGDERRHRSLARADRRRRNGAATPTSSTASPSLSRRHFEAVERLLPPEFATEVLAEIGSQLDDLRALLKATGILRAASPSAHDAIVCTGELMNSRILAAALAARRRGDGVGRCAPRDRHRRRAHRRRAAGRPKRARRSAREIVPRVAEGRVPVAWRIRRRDRRRA